MAKKNRFNPSAEMLVALLIPALVFSVLMSVRGLPNSAPKNNTDEKNNSVLISSELSSISSIEVSASWSNESINQSDPNSTYNEKTSSEYLTYLDVPIYSGVESVNINGGNSVFAASELKNDGIGWVVYGNLDELNRVTTMNALITPDMYNTGTDADSRILPTGWKKSEQNEGNPNQLNRGHLLADVLGGSGEDWRNLITLYRNANYPIMYFEAEEIVKKAIQNGTVVRYRVTPIFAPNDLLCSGVHIMAKSVTDNTIDLNVYVYNQPKGELASDNLSENK